MHKIIPYILAACCLCMVASCNTVFDVHPYDVQIDGDRNLNVTNIQKIEASSKVERYNPFCYDQRFTPVVG